MYSVLSSSGQRRPGIRSFSSFGRTPMAPGLYDPAYEHDACGVGMVADLHGRPDHDIVDRGLTVLERLAHRGASGAEVNTGDGAGILVQIPHRFLAAAAQAAGFTLPDAGGYAVGLAFLPTDTDAAGKARTVVEETAAEEGLTILGWRTVPTETDGLGLIAKGAMPLHRAALRRPLRARRRHHGAGAARLRAAQAGGARARRRLLPVAVRPHDRLQGDADLRAATPVLPRPARPDLRVGPRARALALLDQHLPELAAGPSRTATSATTARSTRWPATATGCAPARRCSRRPSLRGTCPASTRSARRGRATRPASTRCSSCCTSAGAPCRTPCS